MIERLTKIKKEHPFLLNFLQNNTDYDFYLTEKNSRIYITDTESLELLLKNSTHVYTLEDKEDFIGIILAWKSMGGGVIRHYVKVNAKTPKIAQDLLSVLLWNFNKDLYIKLRKDHKFLPIFRRKGFKFVGGRGIQILLKRKYIKETEDARRNSYQRRDSS